MSEMRIPEFLLYPDDPVSKMMFEEHMKQIKNFKCGYSFMLYTESTETVPVIEEQAPPFEINETHYYCLVDVFGYVTKFGAFSFVG